ncbi:MAG: hypothetical protein IKO94_08815 [Selenomonadaceae bacterium]|nr:hypothetical protein [Selenomonadaceae bacterium]
MILRFATHRDQNGNRYYLCVDFDTKAYAEEPRTFYRKGDFIEISKAERRRLKEEVIGAGFTPVDYI